MQHDFKVNCHSSPPPQFLTFEISKYRLLICLRLYEVRKYNDTMESFPLMLVYLVTPANVLFEFSTTAVMQPRGSSC